MKTIIKKKEIESQGKSNIKPELHHYLVDDYTHHALCVISVDSAKLGLIHRIHHHILGKSSYGGDFSNVREIKNDNVEFKNHVLDNSCVSLFILKPPIIKNIKKNKRLGRTRVNKK